MSIYITCINKVVFIQLLRFALSIYFTLIVESTENATLTVVKTCLPHRWPSGAQVERGLVGMHGIVG